MLKETKKRLKTPPANKYWNDIFKVAVGLVTVSCAVLALPLAGVVVPGYLITSATYVVTIGGAFGISARATTK